MSGLGILLVFLGVLVIAAPLGWIGLTKLQEASDKRYLRQKSQGRPKT